MFLVYIIALFTWNMSTYFWCRYTFRPDFVKMHVLYVTLYMMYKFFINFRKERVKKKKKKAKHLKDIHTYTTFHMDI